MFHHGVKQYDLVTFGIEGEILELHRGAVEAHQVAGLAEEGSELVHDATFHADIIMLRGLTDARQLKLVDVEVKQLVEGKGVGAFQGC